MKALGLALAAALLAIAGCGSSDGETGTIGTTELTISSDEKPDSLDEFFQLLSDKTPYLPSFVHCIQKRTEETTSSALLDEIEEVSGEEAERRGMELSSAASQACAKPGRHYIDPNASAEQFDVLRSSEQVAVGNLLREKGTPRDLVVCLEQGVGDLSTDELIELVEGSTRQQGALFERIARVCESQS